MEGYLRGGLVWLVGGEEGGGGGGVYVAPC